MWFAQLFSGSNSFSFLFGGCPTKMVQAPKRGSSKKKDTSTSLSLNLPLKNTTFLDLLGNMGYMSVKDENFPRA